MGRLRRLLHLLIPVTLLLASTCGSGEASTITWKSAVNGSWHIASNWLPAQVPGPADVAVISASGNYTVTISSNANVSAIGLSGGTGTRRLNVNGAVVSTSTGIAVASSNVLTLSSGVISGAGTLDLTGTLNSSGNSAINSPVVTHTSTAISVSGDSLKVSSSFESQGTLQLAAPVPVFLYVNGTLTNASSGTLQVTSQGAGFHGYLKGTLDNRGTVTIAGDCVLDRPSAQHQNTGSISIAGADLTIRQTGSSPSFTGSGGIVFINAGRTLHVDGGTITVVGGSVNGGGALHLSNGANADFLVVPQISALDMQNATGSFPGTFNTNDTSISLLNSDLIGTVQNAAGHLIPIVNSIFEGTLINLGTLDIQGSSSLLAFLSNAGTVTIGNGLILASGDTGQLNSGLIAVNGGTFSVQQTPAGYFSNGGTIDALPGTTVQVTGGNFRNEVSGVLRGSGTYDVSGTTFLNSGMISPGASPGILTIAGDVTLGSTSILYIEIAGTTPGTGYDQIQISGHVALNGSMNVFANAPIPGTTFDPVTCATHSGQITVVSSVTAPNTLLALVPQTRPNDPIRLTTVEETWTFLAPTGGPPAPRSRHSAVYDAFSNRLIVFGGFTNAGEVNDTWILTHANGYGGQPVWQQLSPNSALPMPRQGHAAAYDALNNRLIIYGGYSAARPEGFDEVWVLSNANGLGGTPAWQNLATGGGTPDRRVGGGVGYNPGSNRLILFGGVNPINSCPNASNDVWILTNANGLSGPPIWSPLPDLGLATRPNARSGAVLAYDDGTNRLIVNGGVDACDGVLSDTYYLTHADGTGGTPAWTSLPLSNPAAPGRTDHAGIYDVMTDRLVTFGGILPNGTTYLDDILLITSATNAGSAGWSVLPAPGAHPSARFDHSASWDPITRRIILFGGDSNDGLHSDVWTLHLDLEPGEVSGVSDPLPPAPDVTSDFGFQRTPWPNPTKGPATLSFAMPASGEVAIDVFNVAGQRVGRLFSGVVSEGRHEVHWNGEGEAGAVPSGIYFLVLRSGVDVDTRRVVVSR